MTESRRELNRSLWALAEFQRGELGDWEPQEGAPTALVDGEWLLGLLAAYRDGRSLRLQVRDLALKAGYDTVDLEKKTGS